MRYATKTMIALSLLTVGCGQSIQDKIAIAELKERISFLTEYIEGAEANAKSLAEYEYSVEEYKEAGRGLLGNLSEPTLEEFEQEFEAAKKRFEDGLQKTSGEIMQRAEESRVELEKKKKLLSEIE